MPDAWMPADPQMGDQPPLNPNPPTSGANMAGSQNGGQEGGMMGANQSVDGGMIMVNPLPMGGNQGGTEAGQEMGGNQGGSEILPPDPRINAGWIGGPCLDDGECAYDEGICLPDNGGYPRGMCTQSCTRFCPDQDGLPVTFCIEGVLMQGGACVQKCDYIAFDEGCRPGYQCTTRSRFSEPDVADGVCLPSDQVEDPTPIEPPPNASSCIQEITDLGLNYEYRGDQADSPSNNPNLQCYVEDGVRVQSPINGVVYRYVEHSTASPLYGSCSLMRALYDLSALLREYNIVEVGHIGTYNCRVISGTNTLSRHGFGDALDIAFVRTADGTEYNLLADWEHDTTAPVTTAGRVLYELSREMQQRNIFNIILTPNFNSAHDNHFHLDLTPDQNFYGKMDENHNCDGKYYDHTASF
jgi:hypothetical protein